ncbi:hypothetical protein K9U39_17665 [Rhodoblastus acidophilus]|uniref:Uncharacterized protein n=1 Tax=Candidatus Rhodoblastus alkanivorans TaxID=2954117 RepID=A0ABS9Z220_9HYPH|nr:hypothetical protein [Candidatus Rhodoblastus alkanivorans]MCI4679051.1 hypothetical protein [Candidatus Rhodoblastus alkanivorans]MCI4681694.1 hypothetical protein [Candidatus Rhodoblastus alkanivorans]MDI4642742.1 hypothetical protein [Rhodoblastus acidophilus]
MPNSKPDKPTPKAHLIVSDDAEPAVKLKPGMRFEVVATTIVDVELKEAGKIAARLCGGTTTCLALVEI